MVTQTATGRCSVCHKMCFWSVTRKAWATFLTSDVDCVPPETQVLQSRQKPPKTGKAHEVRV